MTSTFNVVSNLIELIGYVSHGNFMITQNLYPSFMNFLLPNRDKYQCFHIKQNRSSEASRAKSLPSKNSFKKPFLTPQMRLKSFFVRNLYMENKSRSPLLTTLQSVDRIINLNSKSNHQNANMISEKKIKVNRIISF